MHWRFWQDLTAFISAGKEFLHNKMIDKNPMRTDAQRRAKNKYNAKTFEVVSARIRIGSEISKDDITDFAKAHGLSLNQFILDAISEKIERMQEEDKK